MMKTILVTLVVVLATIVATLAAGARIPKGRAVTKEYTYERYVADYSKAEGRSLADHAMRRALYNAELEIVLAHNANPAATWVATINQFSDMTDAEKKSYRMPTSYSAMKQKTNPGTVPPMKIHTAAPDETFAHEIDWTKVRPRVVSDVRDQGMCGSCWGHGATEAISARYAIATGKLQALSVQQMVSCAPDVDQCGGTGGCNGNNFANAFSWAASVPFITVEDAAPYMSYFGKVPKCVAPNKTTTPHAAAIEGYVKVNPNDARAMMSALKGGPVAIAAWAMPWMRYHSGVLNNCSGKDIDIDHGILVVGYGYDDVLKAGYWKIQNSWSSSFGENGFIRLYRAADPAKEPCGWDTTPLDGVACKNQTKAEWVCGCDGMLMDPAYPVPTPLE